MRLILVFRASAKRLEASFTGRREARSCRPLQKLRTASGDESETIGYLGSMF
jgi:hypothetical protein